MALSFKNSETLDKTYQEKEQTMWTINAGFYSTHVFKYKI